MCNHALQCDNKLKCGHVSVVVKLFYYGYSQATYEGAQTVDRTTEGDSKAFNVR